MDRLLHDLRASTAIIIGSAQGIQRFLPELISVYHCAKAHGLVEASIQPRTLELLQKSPAHILQQTKLLVERLEESEKK